MKKNWIPIALLVAFIFGYNYLVVQPITKKQQAERAAANPAVQAETAALPAANNPTAALNAAPAKAGVDANGNFVAPPPDMRNALLSDEVRNNPETLTINDKRSVSIFKDGTIGGAVFQDYFEREKNIKTPIVLLPQGFRYTSTDAAVANCLNSLKLANRDTKSLVFKAENPKGSCSLTYGLGQDGKGLVVASIELNGFTGSRGTVEVKSIAEIGKGPTPDHNFLAFKIDGSQKKIKEKKLFEPETVKSEVAAKPGENNVDWLVWGDRYFESAILPGGKFIPSVFHEASAVDKFAAFGLRYELFPEGGAQQKIELSYFFGTRDVATLSAVKPGLEDSIEFGFFRGVSQALLWCLKQINQFVHNFGVSIIILTLVVRMIFWPLNKKVFSSSQKMKAIQPEIDKMKARYAGNKSKEAQSAMNMEMLSLYKKHGVNPVGSCLPLFLQMPIFIGLYGALNHSMDLYQAPFFGWIQDLSSKDPFYIFPALWTLSLLGYVQLNPTPQQSQPGMPDMKWMMAAMNLFFGFLSKDWPAGLTLYLFVSNLVGISQQLMMRRQAQKLQPIQEGA